MSSQFSHQGVLCRQAAMAPPAGGDAKGDGVRRALREKPGEPNIGRALFLLPLSTSARVISSGAAVTVVPVSLKLAP